MNFIRELLHEEYTAATFHLQSILVSWIGDLDRIKSTAFIRNKKLDHVALLTAGNDNLFLVIKAVAVYHGVVDRFGEADQDIGIERFIYVLLPHQLLDEGFHLTDAAGMRRQL